MSKHFHLDITDTAFSFARKTAEIAAEAATDGVYVIRTSLPKEAYVYQRLADRVRAHVFLCMLAYYLEWHMRQRLAPMLFDVFSDNQDGCRIPHPGCSRARWRRVTAA